MEDLDLNSQISRENFNEYCRTCLKECKHEGYDVEALSPPLFRLFRKCASYKSTEKHIYPNFLCPSCYDMLKKFVEFRFTASRTALLLEETLKAENTEEPIFEGTDTDSLQNMSILSLADSPGMTDNDDCESSKASNQVLDFEEILINTEPETTAYDDDISSTAINKTPPKNDGPVTRRKKTVTQIPQSEKKPFSVDRLYVCPYCNRKYHYSYHLSKHLTNFHDINDTFITCHHERCKKTFSHHETAAQHYELKHERGLKVLKPRDTSCICEDCGRTFSSMHQLREHRYQHEPKESRPFQCEQCNKHFVKKRSYKEHLLRHAGIKSYECTHCGMKKTSVRELRVHVNNHTKEKQFPCPLCPRVFSRLANLNSHNRVVHKGIRKYKCRFCDLSFGKPHTLKYHEMRHTGEKPHACTVCGRSFIQPAALKAHEKALHHKNENEK